MSKSSLLTTEIKSGPASFLVLKRLSPLGPGAEIMTLTEYAVLTPTKFVETILDGFILVFGLQIVRKHCIAYHARSLQPQDFANIYAHRNINHC